MTRKTAQQRRAEAALANQSTAIRKAFLEAITAASGAVDHGLLIRLLEQGDIESAAQLLRIDRGVIYPLEEAIRQAFIAGGLSVKEDLQAGLRGQFGFDGRHPRAVAIAERQAADLVTNISDDAIANARAVIVDGMQRNQPLASVARDLRGNIVGRKLRGGIIGLTQPQTDRMLNIRAILADPDRIGEYFEGNAPRYLESNRRYDAMVRRAIKDGRALSQADINHIADAYQVKATGRRATRVAQHQARLAQSGGRDEGYRQLSESGKVEAVTCRWQHTATKGQRDDHAAIDGTVIEVGEDFVLPDDTRMSHPHDPRGGIKHTAGCKCIGIYRVRLPKE